MIVLRNTVVSKEKLWTKLHSFYVITKSFLWGYGKEVYLFPTLHNHIVNKVTPLPTSLCTIKLLLSVGLAKENILL